MFRYQTCHQASYHHEGISTQHHNPSPPPPISPPSPQALIMSLVLGSAVVSGLTLNADAVLQVMGLDPQTSDPHLVDMARDFLAVRWVMDETLPLSHFRLNKYRQFLPPLNPRSSTTRTYTFCTPSRSLTVQVYRGPRCAAGHRLPGRLPWPAGHAHPTGCHRRHQCAPPRPVSGSHLPAFGQRVGRARLDRGSVVNQCCGVACCR